MKTESPPIALSFDVEDWFCVKNMQAFLPFSAWNQQEYRVRVGLDYVLTKLRERNIKATFFILGWIAEKSPALVADIAREGHEIGSHGFSHTPITQLAPEAFETDLKRSLEILRSLCTKQSINGFRAPSFSVTKDTLWALPILKRNGIRYDSSIFPTHHPDYGIPGFDQAIQPNVEGVEGLTEVPMTVVKIAGMPVPVSGGGYFRLFPYPVFRRLLKRAVRQAASRPKRSTVLYFHPWEFDPSQPKMQLPRIPRFRHYHGLENNRQKFERLLDEFSFCTLEESILRNI